MPKGKKNHKGLHRRFTAPEEIERQLKEGKKDENESSSEESESEEEEERVEGAAGGNERGVIEVCNPNYQKEKNKKLSEIGEGEVPTEPGQMTRRQREEVEAERAKREYERLHMAGKTAEAQADLARLALVRREREEAAKKREAEKEAKEASRSMKNLDIQVKLQEKAIRGPCRGRNARKKAEKKEAEKNKAKGDDSAAKASSKNQN